MKKSRNYNLEKVVVDDNFNITVKSMRNELIEKLEKELELLKSSE